MSSATFEKNRNWNPNPRAGFDEFEVPEVPAYITSYSKRGNAYDAEVTPVYQQTRFGNREGIGGMSAYLSQVEQTRYFEGYKQKKGNHGVYTDLRWTPGYDWRGGYGVASLDALKNVRHQTRGGQLRAGGPKRSDYVDKPGYFFEPGDWFDKAIPGIATSRMQQNLDNYAGVYDYKRQTPIIERETDPLVLRQMIEYNPFHIRSHCAAAAKVAYDKEYGKDPPPGGYPAYDTGLPDNYDAGVRHIYDHDPRLPQHEVATDPRLIYNQDLPQFIN